MYADYAHRITDTDRSTDTENSKGRYIAYSGADYWCFLPWLNFLTNNNFYDLQHFSSFVKLKIVIHEACIHNSTVFTELCAKDT